jgi:hypothetical protein
LSSELELAYILAAAETQQGDWPAREPGGR